MRPVALDTTHGGNARADVLDFSVSVNPLGPPDRALAAYGEAAGLITRYPPPHPERLVARLAEWARVSPQNVIAGNGSTQLIYLLARALRPVRPLVVTPTFSEIANALIKAGVTPYAAETDRRRNFEFSTDDAESALGAGADAIFLGRPNSPTGAMLPLKSAAALAERCARRRAWCVFDEAFIDFAGERESLATLVRELPTLVLVRSLTKIFALPGLRIGYLVAAPDLIARLKDAIEPWSVNGVAERVALACLDRSSGFIERTLETVARERAYLAEALGALPGLTVFPSAANFLMLDVAEDPRRESFGAHMLKGGIAVRDLGSLPGCGPGFYRVAVRLRPENERLLMRAASYSG